MTDSLGFFLLLLAVLAPFIGAWLWWRFFNNPDGERYLRQDTQRPWAPMPDKEVRDE